MCVWSFILTFLLFFLLRTVSSQNCNVTLAPDIEYYTLINTTQVNCGCKTVPKRCIRKCCLPGFLITETEYLQTNGIIEKVMECVTFNSTKTLPLKISFYKNQDYVETKIITDYISGIMNCELYKHFKNFFPQKKNNRVYIPTDSQKYWDSSDLCLDYYYNEYTALTPITLKCRAKKNPNFYVPIVGMIKSCFFLLASFIILILQPQKNLHTQILLFYITNLILAFIHLIIIQLDPGLKKPYCALAGFLCLFFFTSSIFWINIICIDIYLTFAGFFGFSNGNQGGNKRLKYYALYGILTPTLLVMIVLFYNVYGNPFSKYHPLIGVSSCFLENGLPYLIYLHGPKGTLFIINIILFILTAISIYKQKKAAKVLKTEECRISKEDRDSFVVYLKLLLAMGLTWSLETISWAYDTDTKESRWLWYLPVIGNVCYGMLIFFMFACKSQHWKNIQHRCCRCTNKEQDMTGNENTQVNTSTASSTEAVSSL